MFGLEADIQGSTQKDNKTCILTCTPGLMAAYDATLPWFGTVRGRLGYSVGSTLFYATGGLAYGSIKTKIATNSFVGPVTQSFSHTNTGWTAGAGGRPVIKASRALPNAMFQTLAIIPRLVSRAPLGRPVVPDV